MESAWECEILIIKQAVDVDLLKKNDCNLVSLKMRRLKHRHNPKH